MLMTRFVNVKSNFRAVEFSRESKTGLGRPVMPLLCTSARPSALRGRSAQGFTVAQTVIGLVSIIFGVLERAAARSRRPSRRHRPRAAGGTPS